MASRSELPKGGHELSTASINEHGGHGGLFATILSAIALGFSGLSYYDSNLKTSDLTVYVPPMIHYGRDGAADVFNLPITINNDGARSGTVLIMELEVENLRADAEKKKARFHSAFLGEYPRNDTTITRSFAPLSIPGHGTFTETVRFYPMDDTPGYLVDDKGDYRFTLKLITAKSPEPDLIERLWQSDPKPLTFELNLPYLSVQYLAFQHGTQAMFNKAWQPAVSGTASGTAPDAKSAPAPTPPASPQAPGAGPGPGP